MADPKEALVRYLQGARDSILWKLDGLSEYDARRPLTPTGHADILREMVDGAAGFMVQSSNLPGDGFDWTAYVANVEAAAATFR